MSVRVGFGLGVANMIGERRDYADVVDALEAVGFDSLWLSEVASSHALDPVAAIGFAAARTKNLRLGTSVMVLPGRAPALVAKALATLDLLAGGRFLPIFGLGTSHPDENQAFAVEPSERGPWLDEALPLIRRFWLEEAVTHHGRLFDYDALSIQPRPGPLPVWMGAQGPQELDRVGRLGDGWLGSFCTPDEAGEARERVNRSAASVGRCIDQGHFGVLMLYSLGPPSEATLDFLNWRRPGVEASDILPCGADAILELVERFCSAGCSKFILIPADRPSSWTREIERLGDEVLRGLQPIVETGSIRESG